MIKTAVAAVGGLWIVAGALQMLRVAAGMGPSSDLPVAFVCVTVGIAIVGLSAALRYLEAITAGTALLVHRTEPPKVPAPIGARDQLEEPNFRGAHILSRDLPRPHGERG